MIILYYTHLITRTDHPNFVGSELRMLRSPARVSAESVFESAPAPHIKYQRIPDMNIYAKQNHDTPTHQRSRAFPDHPSTRQDSTRCRTRVAQARGLSQLYIIRYIYIQVDRGELVRCTFIYAEDVRSRRGRERRVVRVGSDERTIGWRWHASDDSGCYLVRKYIYARRYVYRNTVKQYLVAKRQATRCVALVHGT
jgi:hypothetical protein